MGYMAAAGDSAHPAVWRCPARERSPARCALHGLGAATPGGIYLLLLPPACPPGRSPTRAGELSCAPNAKNPRDLDISVRYAFKGKKGSWEGSQDYRMR